MAKNFIPFYKWCIDNGDRGTLLLSQWTGIRADNNNNVDIHKMHAQSSIKLLWKCCNNHIWITDTAHRTTRAKGGDCPFCDKTNSLRNWINNNQNIFAKTLHLEWTGISEDNEILELNEVTSGSNKRMLWLCNKCNSTWVATIKNRTIHRSGCPNCKSSYKTSYQEQFLYYAIKQIYPDTVNRAIVLKSKENPRGIEFDIGIPSIRICIEYSPTYWHSNRVKSDNTKRDICDKYGVHYIEIVDDSYKELNSKYTDKYICDTIGNNTDKLIKILRCIFKDKVQNIDFNKAHYDAINTVSSGYRQNEYSIRNTTYGGRLYEEVLDKDALSIEAFLNLGRNSHKRMFWRCNKCSYGMSREWSTMIASRTIDETGCPKCGYNIFKDEL